MRAWKMVHVLSLLVAALVFSAAACTTAAPTPTVESKPQKPVASPATASTPTTAAAPTAAAKPAATTKVQVGVLNSGSDAGIFIAMDKGFFAEQGLDVELQRFDTGATMTAPLAAGQLDIGAGSPSAGLYNAVARDISIKIVADKGSDLKGFGYQGMVVRKDLADKVKDYKDLKGLKIGMTGTGGISPEIVLARALRQGGLTMKDVEVVAIPYGDLNNALANKAIDAAVHWEPLFTVGVQQGITVDWKRVDVIYPDHQSATILYGAEFTKKKPDAANKWMVGYVKGLRYYNDAFRKGTNKAEVLQIIAKYTNVKPEVLEKTVPTGLNPDGYANFKGLSDDLDLLREMGYIKEQVDIKQVVDNQYVDFAVKQLGQYKP